MGGVVGGQTPAMGGGDQTVRDLSSPLFQAKGWMKFLGVLMIVYGVLMIFTIVGIIICWLPIWMGILLFKTASAVEAAQAAGDATEFKTAMEKLKTYFTIQGILALVGILFAILSLAISGGAILTALRSGVFPPGGGY